MPDPVTSITALIALVIFIYIVVTDELGPPHDDY